MAQKKSPEGVIHRSRLTEESKLRRTVADQPYGKRVVLPPNWKGWYAESTSIQSNHRANHKLTELSLTVPITNSLAFLFTVLGEWWAEGKVISKGRITRSSTSIDDH